jgi:protein ImuA
VWPYPRLLVGKGDAGASGSALTKGERLLLERSIFVAPPDDGARLWSIDLALRCAAVAAVIADGRRLTMAATRRLQLAAEAGGALALLARPAAELSQLSAAATRWQVTTVPGRARPCWSIELLRWKGRATGFAGPAGMRRWQLEWDHAKGVVTSLPAVADRPGAAPVETARGLARRTA